jgi:tRNA(Ile)-lysidine synthase
MIRKSGYRFSDKIMPKRMREGAILSRSFNGIKPCIWHNRAMRDDDNSSISASEAKTLFAGWRDLPALVLAVSGGPDSVALMWLAARWRKGFARGPKLVAVTIDHGLRKEAAREAREVKRLARSLDLEHRTLRWAGDKPSRGVPAAARDVRYRLLAQAARAARATHVLTAHTRDDQAETLLMRLLRGSGIAGLSAMARESERDGILLARPLLDVPKSRLIATLNKAKIAFADDPTNRDAAFTRPRLRALLPLLAAEGGDARRLARLAARLARANEAVEVLTDGAERYLALRTDPSRPGLDARAFADIPEEIRLRLLRRSLDRVGHEGPAELGKVEALLTTLDRAIAAQSGLKTTLAGAVASLARGRIRFTPAPLRKQKRK